jgi:hypothetical protein
MFPWRFQNRAMKLEAKSALILAASLCLFSWLGFTDGIIALLPFPVVLFLALRTLSHSGAAADHAALRHAGWSIVWRAAVPFALFTTGLGLFTYSSHSVEHAVTLALVLLFGTLVATSVVGWVCTLVIAALTATPARCLGER